MKNLKLLVVTQYFWPEEFRINDICYSLKEKGCDIEVLTGIPNYPKGEFFDGYSFFKRGEKIHKGLKVNRCYLFPRGRESSFRLMINYISFVVSSLFHIPKILSKEMDSIFVFQVSPITTAIPAIIIGKIKSIPKTIYIQDLWPQTFFSIKPIKNKFIVNILSKICFKIYNSFDKLFIASEGYRDILIKSGISQEKIIYLPQWAEELYTKNELYLNELYLNDNKYIDKKFTITFAGNLGKAQSVDTILEAAKLSKENKNIEWIILGDGSEFDYMSNKVKEYKLEETLKLLGRKPSSEMPYYFKKSDALLVTLKKSDIFEITVPAKIQSYMSSGKPILSATNGESMKIIKESNCGLACEAEDYVGLYENIKKLYNMDIEERNKLGKNGIDYFNNNFNRDNLINKLHINLLELVK